MDVKDPAFISALSALISVIILGISTFKKSRRELLDELKLEILVFVSSAQGRDKWKEAMDLTETEGSKVPVLDLLNLLSRKYQKKKWYRLMPAAVAELRNEGYHEELSMSASRKIINQPLTIQTG